MPAQTTEPARTVRALIALSLDCVSKFLRSRRRWPYGWSRLAAVTLAVAIAALVAWAFWRRPDCSLDEWMGSRTLKGISGLATIAALFQLPACASSSSIPLKSAARLLLRASGSQNPGLQSRCQYAGSLSGVQGVEAIEPVLKKRYFQRMIVVRWSAIAV